MQSEGSHKYASLQIIIDRAMKLLLSFFLLANIIGSPAEGELLILSDKFGSFNGKTAGTPPRALHVSVRKCSTFPGSLSATIIH